MMMYQISMAEEWLKPLLFKICSTCVHIALIVAHTSVNVIGLPEE